VTYQPDPEKLGAMFDALSLADECVRHMVLDELRATKLPELIAAEERAAADFRDALGELEQPAAALAALEGDIAKAETECQQLSSQLASESISARIAARAAYQEWDAELTALTGKREAMERDIMPLRQARDEAQNHLYWASRDREGIEFNISDPRYAYVGHGPETDAFKWWLTYFAARTLQFGQRDDPGIESGRLHERAIDFLEFLCVRTGYRTDKLSQRDADNMRRYWDEIYNRAQDPGPVPSGADIVAQTFFEGAGSAAVAREQARLEHTVTEDHRKPDPVKQVQRLHEVRGFLKSVIGGATPLMAEPQRMPAGD
jgi:hypothetical protein